MMMSGESSVQSCSSRTVSWLCWHWAAKKVMLLIVLGSKINKGSNLYVCSQFRYFLQLPLTSRVPDEKLAVSATYRQGQLIMKKGSTIEAFTRVTLEQQLPIMLEYENVTLAGIFWSETLEVAGLIQKLTWSKSSPTIIIPSSEFLTSQSMQKDMGVSIMRELQMEKWHMQRMPEIESEGPYPIPKRIVSLEPVGIREQVQVSQRGRLQSPKVALIWGCRDQLQVRVTMGVSVSSQQQLLASCTVSQLTMSNRKQLQPYDELSTCPTAYMYTVPNLRQKVRFLDPTTMISSARVVSGAIVSKSSSWMMGFQGPVRCLSGVTIFQLAMEKMVLSMGKAESIEQSWMGPHRSLKVQLMLRVYSVVGPDMRLRVTGCPMSQLVKIQAARVSKVMVQGILAAKLQQVDMKAMAQSQVVGVQGLSGVQVVSCLNEMKADWKQTLRYEFQLY